MSTNDATATTVRKALTGLRETFEGFRAYSEREARGLKHGSIDRWRRATEAATMAVCISELDAVAVALSRALSEPESSPWQSIDSAPKDGTRIICWGPRLAVAECEWRQQWQQYDEGWYRSNQHPLVEPTHWMPLPPAPDEAPPVRSPPPSELPGDAT